MTPKREPALRIRVAGPGVRPGRLALADLMHVGRQLQTAVERIALVLRGGATSLRPGRRPAEVVELCRLDLVGFGSGSAILELDLAGPERPFPAWDLGETALDCLVRGLQELGESSELPAGWDSGVLVAWRELGSLLDRGVERVEIERSGRGVSTRSVFTQEIRDRIVRQIRAPVQNLIAVEGRLLMADFDETRLRCRIHPPFGTPATCSFREDQREAVLELLTKYVRVVGEAEMDEQGRVRPLKIADIEPINPPGETQAYPAFWEHPTVEDLAITQGVSPIQRIEGLAANLWNTDEDLQAFLDDIYSARDARTD